MAREFRLTEPAYHGGRYQERGAIVSLLPHERPGPHMVPSRPMMPRAAPLVVAPVIASTSSQAVEIVDRSAKLPENPVIWSAPHAGYLILDTETHALANPRLASIALIFADAALEVQWTYATLIKPDGWIMTPEAGKVNGLSMERLEAEGVSAIGPLLIFQGAVASGREIVAHNLPFDMRVVANELREHGMPDPPATGICTMASARAAGSKGTLATALKTLAGIDHVGAHEALADAMACLELLRALRRKEAA